MDRRQKRTISAMTMALTVLLSEKPMNQITVSELTDRANVNRGTFYLHFSNIADLYESLEQEKLNELDKLIRNIEPRAMFKHFEHQESYPIYVNLLKYYKNHADFYRMMLGPNGSPKFRQNLVALMRKHLQQKLVVSRTFAGNYMIEYSITGTLGIIYNWLEKGSEHETPEQITMMIMTMICKGPLVAGSFTIGSTH